MNTGFTEKLLKLIGDKYPLCELPTDGYDGLRVSGMRFSIKAYRAEGLGHVSIMSASGFFGLMRMDTLIINPTQIDLPLLSYDGIYAMGNDTRIIELYDTMLNPCSLDSLYRDSKRCSDIRERDPGKHWYDGIKLPQSISKKAKKDKSGRLDKLSEEYLGEYLALQADKVIGEENKLEKQRKSAVYVEGLLENGGPSTDVFVKGLGRERTARLFRHILFGTEEG